MNTEDKLRHIIAESVQDALNEDFTCSSTSTLWDVYNQLSTFEKMNFNIRGYDDFKQSLSIAVDKLYRLLQYLRNRNR